MNADPKRPDKVQRYVARASNGTGTEDLTPDYMNILGGQEASADKQYEGVPSAEPNPHHHHHHLPREEPPQQRSEKESDVVVVVTTAAPGVIPTSPQYGVAIITSDAAQTETPTLPAVAAESSDVAAVATAAKPPEESKDIHTTPNRNDRFKVVKIASLEPFKRGRWTCMDYVDESPPAGSIRVPQSTGGIQLGGPYMQTQSLPQQQIQQMLLQGGFTNGTQFFATGVPTQVLPQGQFFYPAAAQNQSMPQQQQQQVPAGQFIANQQAYFPVQNAAGFTVPQSFPNAVQYVPANLIPGQNSAFVPTSQTVQMPPSFQQGQTYAGQANVLQQQQPVVNGHSFTPPKDQMPTKNVISNSAQPVVSQPQVLAQQQSMQLQAAQSVPVLQNQQFQQTYQQIPQPIIAAMQLQQQQQPPAQQQQQQQLQGQQNVDQSNNNNTHNTANNNNNNNVVYTNPTFAMSVNSLTALDGGDGQAAEPSEQPEQGENADDPAKTNPVVNAIDNKIEQAMDLVKSHLMYTVREEVEVLKEKIAELMERIQQLETENNFLRSQIPKSQQQMPPQAAATAAAGGAATAGGAQQPQALAAAAATATAAATDAMKAPQQQQQQLQQ